jgi:hypothetical protein
MHSTWLKNLTISWTKDQSLDANWGSKPYKRIGRAGVLVEGVSPKPKGSGGMRKRCSFLKNRKERLDELKTERTLTQR